MRTVGEREFRDQATSLMAAGETLAIERHGKLIGFFVPVEAKDRSQGRETLGRLGEALEALREAIGVGEDELAAEISGSKRR